MAAASSSRVAAAAPPLRFAELMTRCTPEKWRLRVRAVKLDDPSQRFVATTIGVPADRDVASELARRGLPPGRYEVRPVLHAIGDQADLERRQCQFQLHQKAATLKTMVQVTGDMVANPLPVRPVGTTLQAARDDAERAKADAERERQMLELERIRVERDELRRRAEKEAAVTARPADPSAGAGAGVVDVLRIIIEQQRQAAADQAQAFREMMAAAAARETALLQALAERDSTPPPPPPPSLLGIVEQIQQLRQIGALLTPRGVPAAAAEPQSDLGSIVALVRDVLSQAPPPAHARQAQRPPTIAAAPQPASAAPAAPAAPGAPVHDLRARADAMARERVAAMVQALATEAIQGTDPAAVADETIGQVGLLPATVRAPLESGSWAPAWAACRAILGEEEWTRADALLRTSPETEAWFSAYAAALAEVDDDGENAEGGEA